MPKYMGVCWQCASCHKVDNQKPWACPICDNETCEYCFGKMDVCYNCSIGKTDKEIIELTGWNDNDEF